MPPPGSSDTSRVSSNVSQSWHSLPGDGVRSHRLRAESHKTAPHFRFQSQVVGPQETHNFCLTWLQIRVSQHLLPLGFDYLLEQLTELRETLTYVYQFIKGYRWTARWQETSDKVWEGPKHRRFLSLWSWGTPPPDNVDVFTNLEALRTQHCGDFTDASSCRHDLLGTPFPAPPTQSHLNRTTDVPGALITQEFTMFSGILCQEQGKRSNMFFFFLILTRIYIHWF